MHNNNSIEYNITEYYLLLLNSDIMNNINIIIE